MARSVTQKGVGTLTERSESRTWTNVLWDSTLSSGESLTTASAHEPHSAGHVRGVPLMIDRFGIGGPRLSLFTGVDIVVNHTWELPIRDLLRLPHGRNLRGEICGP